MTGGGQSCSICGRAFNRLEHLKRHIATHTSEKPLLCDQCGKRFARRDALHRHEQTHLGHRQRSRKFRACNSCAVARVKCIGTSPCARCLRKSIPCIFPPSQQSNDDAGSASEVSGMVDGSPNMEEVQPPMLPDLTRIDPAQRPDTNSPWDYGSSSNMMHQTGRYEDGAQAVDTVIAGSQQFNPITSGFYGRHDDDFVLGSNENGVNIMSSFNWLSPSFDFEMNDLQLGTTQLPPPAPINLLTYPTSHPAEQSSSRQLQESPRLASHNHGTPAVSDTSYNMPSVEGSEIAIAQPVGIDGTFYVDGTGARLPRSGKYAASLSHQASSPQVPTPEYVSGYSFSSHESLHDKDLSANTTSPPSLTQEAYEHMVTGFQELCINPSGLFEAYNAPAFPPLPFFDKLIAAYIQFFHPVLPFLHLPTLELSRTPWILLLALSAVGSQYVSSRGLKTIVGLHEFLRRAIITETQKTSGNTGMDRHILMQAKLLNCVGMMYSGAGQLETYKASNLDDLITYFQQIFPELSANDSGRSQSPSRPDSTWWSWIQQEHFRRFGHCIWLLECMSKYHFETRPRLLLDFADIRLPCAEEAWDASSADVWEERYIEPAATLAKAIRVLYVEKCLLPETGAFSRVLLIHALYCQTWEVANSLARPLLRWVPTARKEDAEAGNLTEELWLPKIPSYARWRNSACDCLDVLHWIANSDIANSGTENPTVLHLHFARIVLLTPYEAIAKLVRLYLDGGAQQHATEIEKCSQLIRRWAYEDQYKARLSLIHSGVLFWHLRRYSVDAFYEAGNVFLATLVLWAYGSFCPQVDLPNPPEREDSESASDSAYVTSIRLDRPTDDELVQLFIKRGRSMKATVAGVGNIAGTRGPMRMLREGCKLLGTLQKWSIRDSYLSTLSSLSRAYELAER